MDSAYEGKSYLTYLKSISTNPKVRLVNFDSTQLRADYILPPNELLTFEHGMGGRNADHDYKLIQEVVIGKNAETSYLKHAMLDASFRQTKTGELLLLEIK